MGPPWTFPSLPAREKTHPLRPDSSPLKLPCPRHNTVEYYEVQPSVQPGKAETLDSLLPGSGRCPMANAIFARTVPLYFLRPADVALTLRATLH